MMGYLIYILRAYIIISSPNNSKSSKINNSGKEVLPPQQQIKPQLVTPLLLRFKMPETFEKLDNIISSWVCTMSDFRLETGDCEERRHASLFSCQCPLASSKKEEAKVEDLSVGLLMQVHCSEEAEGARCIPEAQLLKRVRAEYVSGSQCPPIAIQSRILTAGGDNRTHQKGKATASNQTKNIAKNFGKAIIAFMQRNKRLFRAICRSTSTPYQRICEEMGELKAALTTVMGFREVWTSYKYAECMRMVSQVFLRKSALPYIFNSKVANIPTHLKYRIRFLKALSNPAAFDHIKDY